MVRLVRNLDWQLRIDARTLKGGSRLAVISCELIGDRFLTKLLDESGATDSFRVYSNVNIGGKNYLLLEKDSLDSVDSTLTVVRLFDKTQVCAMDPDRFSSLRNAFLTFLEIGEKTPIAALQLLLSGS
jgi:hypothetical protein